MCISGAAQGIQKVQKVYTLTLPIASVLPPTARKVHKSNFPIRPVGPARIVYAPVAPLTL